MRLQTQIRAAVVAWVFAIAAATAEAADWRRAALVLALAVAMVVAAIASFTVRRIRISADLMVQTIIMALLGPAPAVAVGAGSAVFEARFSRVSLFKATNNVMVFALLGLGGGLHFDALREALDIDRHTGRDRGS